MVARELSRSKVALDEAVQDYVRAHQIANDTEIARIKLHTAVLDLYWRMRPHLRESDCWESLEQDTDFDAAYIWQGEHPITGDDVRLSGVSDLDNWLDRRETVESSLSGPYNSDHQPTTQVYLPADAALAAAEALEQKFKQYGWDADQSVTVEDDPDPI
jgi:hypothetical protein